MKHTMKHTKKKGGKKKGRDVILPHDEILSVRGGFSFGDFVNAVNPVNIVKDKINDVKLLVTDPVKFIEHPSKYIGLLPGVGTVTGTVASQGLKRVGLGKKTGGRKIRRKGVGAV